MITLVNSTDHFKKNTNSSQTLWEKKKNRRRNASKLILQDQNYPDTKTKQRHHKKKKKIDASITVKYGYKNLQYEQVKFNNALKELYTMIKWE